MLLGGAACLLSLAVATAGTAMPAAPARAAVVAPTEGCIAGSVYEDLNDDGELDTREDGIGDVTVTLTGTEVDGNPVSLAVTSEVDGTYVFTGLLPGTYDLTESQPDDHLDGIDTAGSAGGTVTPPDSITGIELTDGETATGYLFGESTGAAIAGTVTDDEGVGIAGVTLTLSDSAGTPIEKPILTDALGDYTFTLLPPGTYTVTETQPAGYGDGGETAGSEGGTITNDQVSRIVLSSGTQAIGYDFDETRGSLAGVVYEDRDNDGVRDAGEDEIQDAVVSLTGTDAAGRPVTRQATTNPDGEYVFAGLLAGTYVVVGTQPSGYLDGKDAAGTAAAGCPAGLDHRCGAGTRAEHDRLPVRRAGQHLGLRCGRGRRGHEHRGRHDHAHRRRRQRQRGEDEDRDRSGRQLFVHPPAPRHLHDHRDPAARLRRRRGLGWLRGRGRR